MEEEKKEEKRERKSLAIILLLLLITCISVGYAALSSSLNINGTSTVQDTTWDVGPDDESITCPEGEICTINPSDPSSVTPDAGKTTPENPNPKGGVVWMDGDTVYFKHVLEKPGDVFTFTTTFKNNGSIDAKVSNVTTSELNSTAKRFLDYTVTYEDGSAVSKNDALAAGETATFKVTVSYKSSVTKLPTPEELALINETADGNTGATSLFTVTYIQA